jgi:hypothetical protein
VRIFSHHPARLARALFAASLVVAAGCGGGGSSSGLPNPGSNNICDPDAGAISIARPSSGFSMNGNNVEIVDSINTDQLNRFTSQFDLNLVDQFGGEIDTGFLTAVNDNGGFHPYTNDFYYAGTLNSGLQSGRTYNVYLNAPNTNCTRGFIAQIFT